MVDFPTPPLAEETAMTLETSFMRLFGGMPRWRRGMVPDLAMPCQMLAAMALWGRRRELEILHSEASEMMKILFVLAFV